MNYSWSFYNPVHIHFGKGSRQKIPDLIRGQSYLVVTTADRRQQMIEDEFLGPVSNNTSAIWSYTVQTNPDIEKLHKISNFKLIQFCRSDLTSLESGLAGAGTSPQ